jgi:hypothetical protein
MEPAWSGVSLNARNVWRIADVDTSRGGLFLFNHFVAGDRQVILDLWDYLADWYRVETGLDNSVALGPLVRRARRLRDRQLGPGEDPIL